MTVSTGRIDHSTAQASRAPGSSTGRALTGSKSDTPHKPAALKNAAGITPRTTPFCFSVNFISRLGSDKQVGLGDAAISSYCIINLRLNHPTLPFLVPGHRLC
jgi:hypothetical protein